MRLSIGSFAFVPTAFAILVGCSASDTASSTESLGTGPRVSPDAATQRGFSTRREFSKAAREPRFANVAIRKPTRSWFSRTITQNVFIADDANGVVDVFDFHSRLQSGQIAGFRSPEGLATDAAADLYVADTLAQKIAVYVKPYSAPPTMLDDNGYYPVGVHVDAGGNIYVANICSGSDDTCTGAGNTVVYKPGSQTSTPLAGGPGRAYFVTTDARGNVWVDGQVSSANPKAQIGYFTASDGTFVPVHIKFAFPGGIAFDRVGNLLLDDQNGAPNGGSILNIYPPGQTSPKESIALQINGDDIIDIALGTANARVFAPDYFSSTTSIVTYPGGETVNTFVPTTFGQLDAVAVVPGTLP